ncbi:RNA-binding protein 2-like [Solanum verrucosum]|uniref:RNA-binding protein 2-like n=1 Tax=Solanum verrucosum TaxID=315347 RepID=UPI0020D172A8|nr:RNA-binding protein 2-like [Solanum verrucosum]
MDSAAIHTTHYLQTVGPPKGLGVHPWKLSSNHILRIFSKDRTYGLETIVWSILLTRSPSTGTQFSDVFYGPRPTTRRKSYGLCSSLIAPHLSSKYVDPFNEFSLWFIEVSTALPEIPQSGMPSGHEVHHYLERNDDHKGAQVVDTESIGLAYDRGVAQVMDIHAIKSAYDCYLQSLVITETDTASTFYRGPELARAGGGGIPFLHVRDPLPSARGPELAQNGTRRPRETLPLPPGASNTLYIKGLPSYSSRREVAHILRYFVGYKEVRLVRRDSKHHAGDPLILGFVDFVDPACASTALSALQGYKIDEHDHDSAYLQLQFSKFPGSRFGGSGSTCGKR